MEVADKLSNLIRELPMRVEKRRLTTEYYKQVGELVKEMSKTFSSAKIKTIWAIFQNMFATGREDKYYNPFTEIDNIDEMLFEITGEKTPYQKTLDRLHKIIGKN